MFGFVLGGPCSNVSKGIEAKIKWFYDEDSLATTKTNYENGSEESSSRTEAQEKMHYNKTIQQHTVEILFKPTIKQLGDNKKITLALEAKQMKKQVANPSLKEPGPDWTRHD